MTTEPSSLADAWDDLREAHGQLAREVAAIGLPTGRFLLVDWKPLSGMKALRPRIRAVDLPEAP